MINKINCEITLSLTLIKNIYMSGFMKTMWKN